MPSRTRSRDSGSIVYPYLCANTMTSKSVKSFTETTSDFVGNPLGDNAFLSEKWQASGGSCIKANTVTKSDTMGAVSTPVYAQSSVPMLTVPTASIARILANTGPLTPRVNLPLFMFELKDVPRMLRHAGDLLLKIRRPSGLSPDREAAAATLAYQFGWKPIVEDLLKLADFGDAVNRRRTELNKANSNRGLKRRITLFEDSKTSSGTSTHWSSCGISIAGPFNAQLNAKQWATCRWNIRDTSQLGQQATFQDGLRVQLGLNPGAIPIAVWQAMPWSWMIDWFAGISNSMRASYNMIYYRPSRVCVMTHRWSSVTWPAVTQGGVTIFQGGTAKRDIKQRGITSNPSSAPTLQVPFLDTFKLSILGSLAILKVRGR